MPEPDPLPTKYEPTDRTKLRRKPMRGSYDRAVVHAILDEALVCHLAFAMPHAGPIVLPTTFVRQDERLIVHGSAASSMLRALGGGVDCAVAVTLLDGLVLSHTAFHHSVNYRSVVAFGHAELLTDLDEKRAALLALIDKVEAGRSSRCRAPNDRELGLTHVLALPLVEVSAKVRSGPPIPDDNEEDAALPYWAGVIPLVTSRGEPIPA
jgi:nitroimidazol reductase NimA-like FMN-containing flavoprotein (pyridoxamine 5'-phosphate oxidase superfamily)